MRAHRRGFTLIELLVVIVIIVILMGIALQVAKTANERIKRAQTVRTMEALRNALAGYYSAYGQYPPTSGTAGTYPGPETLSPPGDPNALPSDPGWTEFLKRFQHGLLFYLMAYNGPNDPVNINSSLPWFPRKSERDTAERWRHYLENVPGIGSSRYSTNQILNVSAGIMWFTNTTFYARDGWGDDIQYQSTDTTNYQGYRLRSVHMTNGWEE